MSRYCELKLIDVLKEEKPDMTKRRSKKTLQSESRSAKTKLCNLYLLKEKNDSPCNNTSDLAENRETRLTKKLNTPTKSNTLSQIDIDSGLMRKVNATKSEITTEKRKRYGNKVENLEEPLSKKICSTGRNHANSSSNPDNKISQTRKRKYKSRESCWENKLTGAKRVSKRLSNLRIEKQKSLKDLGFTTGVPCASIKSKQSISFSARGKEKVNKDLHGKSHKRSKSLYDRNHSEVQINFGKLSHTKRLYPKIAAGRRPATYTVTVKPTGFIQQNFGQRNTNYDNSTDDSFDEDENGPNINSLINHYVEDIQDVVVNETGSNEVSDSVKSEAKEKNESNNDSKSSELFAGKKNVEAICQENDVQTLECGNDDQECTSGSTIVIVDIESGENIECRPSESECRNQRNEHSSEPRRNDEARKTVEKLSDFEDLSEPVSEVVTMQDSNQEKGEEKIMGDEKIDLNPNARQVDTKPETTEKGSIPAPGSCSEGSIVSETNTSD